MADLEEEDLGGLKEIRHDDEEDDDDDFEPPRKSPSKLIIGLLSLVVFVALFMFFRGGSDAPEDPVVLAPSRTAPAPEKEGGDSIALPKEEAFQEMVIEEPSAGDIVIRSEPDTAKSTPALADKPFPNLDKDKRFSNPPNPGPVFEPLKGGSQEPPKAILKEALKDTPKKIEAVKKTLPLPKQAQATPKVAMAEPLRYAVQLGAFKTASTAEALVSRLKHAGYNAYIQGKEDVMLRVRVGVYQSRDEAMAVAGQIRKAEQLDAIVVKR